jgi:hypothetical protein
MTSSRLLDSGGAKAVKPGEQRKTKNAKSNVIAFPKQQVDFELALAA